MAVQETKLEENQLLELVKKLQTELEEEKEKNKKLAFELRTLKSNQLSLQLQVEAEEESITNKLMKHLNDLKKEKEMLVLQVEREEEYLTNTLQKKLEQLKKEKVDLENQLEQEEEYIVNKLRKELTLLQQEKSHLEKKLEEERETRERLKTMQKEMEEIRAKMERYKKEVETFEQTNEKLRQELLRLKTDNFVLQQKILKEHEKLSAIASEKALLQSVAEMDLERQYNLIYRREGATSFATANTSTTRLQRHRSMSAPRRTSSSLSVPKVSSLKEGTKTTVSATTSGTSSPISTHPIASSAPPTVALSPSPSPSSTLSSRARTTPLSKVEPIVPQLPLKALSSPLSVPTTGSPRNIASSPHAIVPSKRSRSSSGMSNSPTKSPHLASVKVLKKGWMRHRQNDETNSILLFCILFENGKLEAYSTAEYELVSEQPQLFLNMDTVKEVTCSKDNVIVITLVTNPPEIHYFKCESTVDTQQWLELMRNLSPYTTISQT